MAFRSVATATVAEAGSITINKPAGVAADDILVVDLACVADAASETITYPATWTQFRADNDGGEPVHSNFLAWKRATASEPANYTFTFASGAADCVGCISAYTGAITTGSPIDSSGGQANASSTSVTAPSITIVDTGSVDLIFSGSIKSLSTHTPPTGMTERADLNINGGLSPIAGTTADEVFSGGGATGTRVATATVAATNIGQLTALTPAAVGGGTTFFQTLAATGSGAAAMTFVTSFFRSLAASGVGTATLSPTTTFARTLAASAVGAAALATVAILPRTLAATATGTATLDSVKLLLQALAVTAVGTAGISAVKLLLQSLAASAVGTAALSTVPTFGETLSAAATGTASLIKGLFKTMGAAATGTAGVVKGLFQSLSGSAVGTAAMSETALFGKTISGTVAAVADLVTNLIAGSGNGVSRIFRKIRMWLGE